MEELLYENHGQKFLIRPMRTVGQEGRDEVASVLSLWAKIGLHEGTETIQSFASIDPKGFLVTVLLNKDQGTSSKDGEIIGCVAGVQIDPTLGHFLGLYAIHPDFQGRGLGVKMWNFLMDKHVQSKMHEKDIEDKTDIKDRNGPNAGLYAVPEHLHTYRDRAGFKIQDMDRNMVVHMSRGGLINTDKLVQKMGNVDVWNILTGQKIPALVDGKKIKDGNTTTNTTNDSDHESDLESRVIVYDKLCTGISHENRSRLLSKCFREGETLSYAAINKFDKQVKKLGNGPLIYLILIQLNLTNFINNSTS